MTLDLVLAIAARHGLSGEPVPLARTGMINDAWRIGDHVVRITRDPANAGEAERERWVAQRVAAAGIRTPALIAADASGAVVPSAYTVYRRADGVLLPDVGVGLDALDPLFRELGGELARIAAIELGADHGPLLTREISDARGSLARTVAAGRITAGAAAEVTAWLDALAPQLGAPARKVFLHRDVHPWNLLVDPATARLTAILDWGDASVGDPAQELIGMPIGALAALVDGYRAAGGAVDRAMIARAVWGGITLACWELRELDPVAFDPRWWRMPPGGWAEHRAIVERAFPGLG